MERNTTITTTITTTTTTRETRAHIPGNDNDDGTILTEIFVFLDFLVASPPPISHTNWLLPTYLLFQITLPLSPSKPTTNYYDEDCTLSHRNTYIPTLAYKIAISHLPRPSLFQDSCPSLSLLRLLIIHTVSLGLHVLNTHRSALLFSTSEESN